MGAFGLATHRAVCQLVDAVEHANRDWLAADRTEPVVGNCLLWFPAHATRPMTIHMIFALFGKELQRAQTALWIATFQRVEECGVGEIDVEECGFTRQLLWRMGV